MFDGSASEFFTGFTDGIPNEIAQVSRFPHFGHVVELVATVIGTTCLLGTQVLCDDKFQPFGEIIRFLDAVIGNQLSTLQVKIL